MKKNNIFNQIYEKLNSDDRSPPEKGKREGGNRWRLRDPALDAALEQGRANTDRATRIAAYRKAQHLLARDLPVIPLWHDDVIAVTSRRLSDFRVPRDARFGTLARADRAGPDGAAESGGGR